MRGYQYMAYWLIWLRAVDTYTAAVTGTEQPPTAYGSSGRHSNWSCGTARLFTEALPPITAVLYGRRQTRKYLHVYKSQEDVKSVHHACHQTCQGTILFMELFLVI